MGITPEPPALEDKAFLVLLVAVTLAFAWILWPFFGAVLWGVILAIVFAPRYRRLLRSLRQRRTLAALATLAIILVLVILPLGLITALLVQEGTGVYERIQSGEYDIGRYFQQTFNALPGWVTSLLDRFGLTNLGLVEERLSAALRKSSQFLAGQALNLGQNALNFVLSLFIMLYLLFFLLRDGDALVESIRAAIPLQPQQLRTLASRFTGVIRATVKGTLVVAVVQGALGGLIFWLLGIHAPALWAALMAVLSLLPAVKRLSLPIIAITAQIGEAGWELLAEAVKAGALDFAKPCHQRAVDRQQQVALPQFPECIRAADHARDGQDLPFGRARRLDTLQPGGRQPEARGAGQRRGCELDVQRMQRFVSTLPVDHVGNDIDGDTTGKLLHFAAVLKRETRPHAEHFALLVDDDAVLGAD